MIYAAIVLAFSVLLFLGSLHPKNYHPAKTLVWLVFSILLVLSLTYPDAGKNWF